MSEKDTPTPEEKRQHLKDYLESFLESINDSPKGPYLKSKKIARDMGIPMSSKEVGKNLRELSEEDDDLIIEEHSRSSTGYVWFFKRGNSE